MGQPLRVLFVTDAPDTIPPLLEALTRGGFEPEHERTTGEHLNHILCSTPWDLVIAASRLARFPDLSVLHAVHSCRAYIPVIIVADEPDEASVVDAMRAGACDYVSLQNLARLAPGVQRVLGAATAARLSPEILHTVLDAIPLPVYLQGEDSTFLACNTAFEAFTGRTRSEITGRTVHDLWPEMLETIDAQTDSDLTHETTLQVYDIPVPHADGTPHEVRFYNAPLPSANPARITGSVSVMIDITEPKELQSRMHQRNERLEQRIIDRTRELEHEASERQRTAATLNQRQRELTSLLETSRDISSILDLNDLLTTIAQRAIALLNADECTLFRLDDTGQALQPILSLGEYADEMMSSPLAVGRGITGSSVASNRPVLANHASSDPRAVHINGTPHNSDEHVMAAPLRFRNRIIGAMLVSRIAKPTFTGNDLNLFVGFAQHAAIAMQNAWLYQSLEAYSESLEQAVKARTVELQQTKERVEAILSSSPDAILLLDTNGTIETANQTFHGLFGYTLEEILHQSPIILAEPARSEAFNQLLYDALAGQPGRLEITAQRRNGGMFDADVALAPMQEHGTVTGMVCSIRNINALKEVERMKDAFVSNVTHELRTPITSLRLYHDLIIKNPARQAHYMDRIKRETSRLERIIEDLLQLSRLDQGRVRLTPSAADLNILSKHYVTDRLLLAEQNQLNLTLDMQEQLPLVTIDKGLVGQALSILLTNALSYTPPGGTITVATRTCEAAGQHWAGITVRDTGPGIPPEEQSKLFMRFFRGSVGHNSGTPGTGLGLALFEEIVQRHHGWVEVHSAGKPGKGAAFSMWFLAQS